MSGRLDLSRFPLRSLPADQHPELRVKPFRVLQFNMQFGQVWDDRDPDHAPVRLEDTIAEILGISETNVGTKINRIKQRLRRDVARTA